MTRATSSALSLDLGPALVQRLLPQRPPFLMVDRLVAWTPGTRPHCRTHRYLSANEPVFQGHFPQLPLMPGALLVEGAGQTASLVYTLGAIEEGYVERGLSRDEMLNDLQNLDRGLTLHPGYRPSKTPLEEAFGALSGMPVGVAGAVRFKFLRPVTPGCVLQYDATLTHRFDELLHFDVTASVADRVVARGSLSAAIVAGVVPPT